MTDRALTRLQFIGAAADSTPSARYSRWTDEDLALFGDLREEVQVLRARLAATERDADALQGEVDTLRDERRQLCELLTPEGDRGTLYDDLLVEAARQLARRAAQAPPVEGAELNDHQSGERAHGLDLRHRGDRAAPRESRPESNVARVAGASGDAAPTLAVTQGSRVTEPPAPPDGADVGEADVDRAIEAYWADESAGERASRETSFRRAIRRALAADRAARPHTPPSEAGEVARLRAELAQAMTDLGRTEAERDRLWSELRSQPHEWPCEYADGGAGACKDSNCPVSRAARAEVKRLRAVLDEVQALAEANHADLKPWELLHTLTVDIPARIDDARFDSRHYAHRAELEALGVAPVLPVAPTEGGVDAQS